MQLSNQFSDSRSQNGGQAPVGPALPHRSVRRTSPLSIDWVHVEIAIPLLAKSPAVDPEDFAHSAVFGLSGGIALCLSTAMGAGPGGRWAVGPMWISSAHAAADPDLHRFFACPMRISALRIRAGLIALFPP